MPRNFHTSESVWRLSAPLFAGFSLPYRQCCTEYLCPCLSVHAVSVPGAHCPGEPSVVVKAVCVPVVPFGGVR